MEISLEWIAKLESVQYNFLKAVLGVKGANPSAALLRAEMAIPSLRLRRKRIELGFWAHLCNAAPDRLLSLLFVNRWKELCLGFAPVFRCRR